MGFAERKVAFMHALSSNEAFVKAVGTRTEVGDGETERSRWKNEDLDVSPPEHRTWRWMDYAGFWAAYGISPGTCADITLPNFVGLLVYWVLTFPLLVVTLPKFRRFVEIESLIMPIAIVGLFIYCMVAGRGYEQKSLSTVGGVYGANLGWAMVSGINSIMGKTSTLVVNQPDIARYAHRRSAVLSQLVALSLCNTVGATLGIFATNSIYNKRGSLVWNPWTLAHDILDHRWGAALFFASGFFVFANAITDICANIAPFGADCMTLFPRWLNINRGMCVAYVLIICINPWYILASATGFLTVLGGYSIFLGPFLSIFVTDYFVIRRGNIDTAALYEPGAQYWYTGGIHWRAFVAWLVAVAFVVPGFATQFGHVLAGQAGWQHLYKFSWFYVVTVAYFALSFAGTREADQGVLEGETASQEASEINDTVDKKV
ncbi:hypothetical protein SCUCBS95973_007148 [Sporothrix curviconia]|uniref:Allantoin permease n=1 Tax=Sporothrix curviconia TaxID=1260050 RepID=A0ABP0CAX0_9PEZI